MARPQGGEEKVLVTNRKALFNYEILDRAEAGIALRGTEVKSIRAAASCCSSAAASRHTATAT